MSVLCSCSYQPPRDQFNYFDKPHVFNQLLLIIVKLPKCYEFVQLVLIMKLENWSDLSHAFHHCPSHQKANHH